MRKTQSVTAATFFTIVAAVKAPNEGLSLYVKNSKAVLPENHSLSKRTFIDS